MRIVAFIGAAALGLAMLALAPVAMALDDPPPEICVLDLSAPVAVEHAFDVAKVSCPVVMAVVRVDPDISRGNLGEATPALCATVQLNALDFASYRLHVDPGRCSA